MIGKEGFSVKKLLALVLALGMVLSLVACGGTTSSQSSSSSSTSSSESSSQDSSSESGGEESSTAGTGRYDALQTVDEEVDLYLYWHNLAPTPNTEPTEESPTVRNACRMITAEWLEAHPNVNIDWCVNWEGTSEWMTVNYTAGTGPDTLFYWGGAQWVEEGWALLLDEIIESPNYYEPGSPVWKDMFPEYLFNGQEATKMAIDKNNHVIAVPVVLAPGSDTAYYYNKDLANELGLSETVATTSWKQLKENILTAREAGYIGFAPYAYTGCNTPGNGGSWDAQFTLNAPYFYPMIEDIDYNGDGTADWGEAFRAQYEKGYWYLSNNPAMIEYWDEYLWRFWYGMEEGVANIDYNQPWTDGQVLYVEEGLWSIVKYASNTELTFEVGMFPPTLQQPEDSEYVCDVEWTDAGPYNPNISTAFNIMDPALQQRPDYLVDYIVDWMKYVMTNEHLSMQIEEGEGVIGATKGCQIPPMLADWFTQSFPKRPSGYQYLKPDLVDQTTTTFIALLEEYAYKMIDEEQFIKEYDEMMYEGTQLWIELQRSKEDEDNSLIEYEEKYGWAVEDWDNPAKPATIA